MIYLHTSCTIQPHTTGTRATHILTKLDENDQLKINTSIEFIYKAVQIDLCRI